MHIWMKIAIGIAIVILIIRPFIEKQRKKRNKKELGSILLKVDTPKKSIFNQQIIMGLAWIALACMNVYQYIKYSSYPYFQSSDTIGMVLFYLVIAITFILEGIVNKYDVEFREKGIYSDTSVIKWGDVNYYFWNKNQIGVMITSKILFFKYNTSERIRVNPEDISKIDEVLKQYITEKPN